MKLITFTVPCYQFGRLYGPLHRDTAARRRGSAEIIWWMTAPDDTGQDCRCLRRKSTPPSVQRSIRRTAGGHGEGVNQGIRNATGMYFKGGRF